MIADHRLAGDGFSRQPTLEMILGLTPRETIIRRRDKPSRKSGELSRRFPQRIASKRSNMSGHGSEPLVLQFLCQQIDEQTRLGRRHAAWREHHVDRDWRWCEIIKHDFQRALIDEIAYLPERAIPYAQTMMGGCARGDRVVGFETTAHAHFLDATVNPKPPCFCLAVTSGAQNALMTCKIIGVIRATVAREIARRAIDDGAKLAQSAGLSMTSPAVAGS